ncbi:NADH-quinone oxidoreductase subunit NuoN [Ferrovum sp. PN-J185]|uniref:NADH-quinone oxidoreductase subunit NuoN n=1 Tax=Ferrovum sp. PN-J185 TaxID=1356306 RepID=UPI00079B715D|nr:NADH-quinone oxidoreductase subunit NuoN [Ferrovum sp. PN-J185]KXW56194.1 NADH-quinone oxidoreductase subunit N [Ferrovum sp. PN-J185]MCC6067744.1 NADH-quinone oxidoreductase subunit NuoN [Ferrovum sp. PN-J185]MDE1892238.1 NADH-quinone oxidoreductase subunit NuoN [Betaproteobacteria bacterium]MDE2056836.1 NADH-quinone oxidoreductase subunit NuoN [Betaproteobacteria bacterium]
MNFAFSSIAPALPEIVLLISLSLLLLLDLWINDENRFYTYVLAQLALIATGFSVLMGENGQIMTAFNGLFISDAMARTLNIFSVITMGFVFAYSRLYSQDRGLFKGEFFVLMLFALLGIMVMISANHFLVLYLGLEMLALAQCALIALQRDSKKATEAAMKYFVLSALASGLLLYGLSMLYGATGSLLIPEVANAIAANTIDPAILVFGLVFVVAGLGFKLGAVPFHMWLPDVYEGSPTSVTLFVASVPKIAAFAFIIRLLVGALGALVNDWQPMLVIMAVLSIGLGNIVAIAQTNIKRMLAYSTISHMGYLILGILSANNAGYAASMFYVASYVIISVAAFGIVLLLSRHGFEGDRLDDFKGLNNRSPWIAFMMLLVMVSMAGIPPSVGFFAKLSVLSAVLDAGYTWLVVYAVIFSLIGAFYYLRIIKLMYMDDPVGEEKLVTEPDHLILIGLNGLVIFILGIVPQSLIDLCFNSIAHSFR